MSEFERLYKDGSPTESVEYIEKNLKIEREWFTPEREKLFDTAVEILHEIFNEKSPIKTPKSKPKKVHRKTHKAAVAKI